MALPESVASGRARLRFNDAHEHWENQLLYCTHGSLTCELSSGIWLVPKEYAIWIPRDFTHAVTGSVNATCYSYLIDATRDADQLDHCMAIAVPPLLRELLLEAAPLRNLHASTGSAGRLTGVVLDQLGTVPREKLYLPLPVDGKLRILTRWLLDNPADAASAADWAARLAISERTLNRWIHDDTGMSFTEWRRQLRVIVALRRMAEGEAVQVVAADFGYDSASGFVAMFRKMVGNTPGRYLREHVARTTALPLPLRL